MATAEHVAFEVPELTRILKGIDPAVFLAAPRVLRRLIRHDRGIGGFGLVVPHRKTYVITRNRLLAIVDAHELDAGGAEDIPAKVILLERPEPDRLAELPIEQALVKYWRMLFHARIDLAMDQKLSNGTLDGMTVRRRIQQIGPTEFQEIAAVLEQEDFLLPPQTPHSIYAEFIAVCWTLRLFAKRLLPAYFPSLQGRADVDALLAAEIDAESLFAVTRPPGAPDPDVLPPRVTQTDGVISLPAYSTTPAPAQPVGDNTQRRLHAKADDMDARGNNVRAAILRTRAAQGANLTLAGARAELGRLCKRLQTALQMSDEQAEQWRKALLPLLPRAARGSWSQEARFLYDLQKVCVDTEKGIFTVDMVEWALSLGKQSIRRPLPGHQEVAIVRHLRQALDRLRFVRLGNGERQILSDLLQHAVEQWEQLMRERFRPAISGALHEAGLQPANVPEEIGRSKLIEELLDRVVDYGHLNFGNLRDAISRNQLKLPDLKFPRQLLLGDPLLRLNSQLGKKLDGVYRRGEIYMRFIHRLSALAFGTKLGRLLMLFMVLPLALAFFTVAAPGLLVEEGQKVAHWIGLIEKPPATSPETIADAFDFDPFWEWGPQEQPPTAKDASRDKHHGLEMPNLAALAGFGVFYLFLIHAPPFRRGVWLGLRQAVAATRWLLVDLPVWLLQRPLVRALLDNRPMRFFRRVLLRPLAYALLASVVAYLLDPDPDAATIAISGCAIFTITIVLAFTRVGRVVEEAITDWLVGIWRWGLADFIPAVIRFFIDLFKGLLEWVEQGLYVVDEWLRFRSGESRTVLFAKAALSVPWFCVTYVFRFAIFVLIEPQINPVKHFPVVTVAHKVMLAIVPLLTPPVAGWLEISNARAGGLIIGVIWLIPGVFGFAVWELKENWKLYAANRSRNLKPVIIGSHGETMLRLLKPGFHSGTIPKLFRKLRRGERRGQRRTVRKTVAALHHVEESVVHFVERELSALLKKSKVWNDLHVELAAVHLATNRVAVHLKCEELGNKALKLSFDQQSGWLWAGVLDPGWLINLAGQKRETFAVALAGLYKMAGVQITREQVTKALAPMQAVFAIRDKGLVIWEAPELFHEAIVDLTARPVIEAHAGSGALPACLMRPLKPTTLLFSETPLSWNEWVRIWEEETSNLDGAPHRFDTAVLP